MNYPSHIEKQLQEWSSEAYRRELKREIKRLERDIAAWKGDRISSEELRHRIHSWDSGPSRVLSQQYDYGPVDANVAFAVVVGILEQRELPEELLQAIEPVLKTYQDMKEKGKLSDRSSKWWSA
jgi:hypothetical protein